MIQALRGLQSGNLNPFTYKRDFVMNREYSLHLSNSRDIDLPGKGVICMDIDKAEERFLVSSIKNGSIFIHDLSNYGGKMSYKVKLIHTILRGTLHAHNYFVETVQWHPLGSGSFSSSSADHKLKIWDANTLEPLETFNLHQPINMHHMSSFSSVHFLIAAAMEDSRITLVDPLTGSSVHQLSGHERPVTCVRWSPFSEYLLASGSFDRRILLWDVRSSRNYLAALDKDNDVAVSDKNVIAHEGAIRCLRFTHNSLNLMSYGSDHKIRLWDVMLARNTNVNFHCSPGGRDVRERGIALAEGDPQEPIIFFPTSGQIDMYELLTGTRFKTLVGQFTHVNYCVFRSTTQELFSAGNDTSIVHWTADQKREVLEKLELEESYICSSSLPTDTEDSWSTTSSE